MFGLPAAAPAASRDHAACSGCSLCFLVCPMWRASRDPRLTPEGIAKALQCGATASDLVAALDACWLCGACAPVCPERIDLPGMIAGLRGQLPPAEAADEIRAGWRRAAPAAGVPRAPTFAALLLPGPDLRADPALRARVQAILGLGCANDDGADLARALESGVEIPAPRLEGFLAPLRGRSLVVEDGLLLREIRRRLPAARAMSLGAALSGLPALRARCGAGDLYVIEARAFHADYPSILAHYTRLRIETGCTLNLDLQRIAIPAARPPLAGGQGAAPGDDGTQAQWILQGRQPARIVVESLADGLAFGRVRDTPVVHLAELAQN